MQNRYWSMKKFVLNHQLLEFKSVIFYQILEGPTCMAGYSLGEITACVCAGVLSFTDG